LEASVAEGAIVSFKANACEEEERLERSPAQEAQVALVAGVTGVPILRVEDFEVLETLDSTPRCTVVRLRERRTGKPAAGKRFDLARPGAAQAQEAFQNEVHMLRKLVWSPAVVELQGVCQVGAAESWIVLELCGGGTLEAWLRRFPRTMRGVVRQLVEAVQQLHAVLICHLDIKPDNILMTEDGRLRLCDFATTCQLAEPGQLLTGTCGTEGFRAPEVSGGDPYCGLKADAFSLGRTLQVAQRYDPVWQELGRLAGELASPVPSRRPNVVAARATLSAGGGGQEAKVEPVGGAAQGVTPTVKDLKRHAELSAMFGAPLGDIERLSRALPRSELPVEPVPPRKAAPRVGPSPKGLGPSATGPVPRPGSGPGLAPRPGPALPGPGLPGPRSAAGPSATALHEVGRAPPELWGNRADCRQAVVRAQSRNMPGQLSAW